MTAQAGQEVDIKLGTIGPGEFDSLPTISSGAVRFVDAAVVGPYEPGGPQQLFRFVAIKPGVAVLSFRHIDDDAATPRTATDTVVVQ